MNPYQITNDMFHGNRTNNQKIYMDHKRCRIAKAILREKNSSRRYNSSRLQTILQSFSNQDIVVRVQNQIYRPMKQKREPPNKPRHIRRQEYKMGKKQSLQVVLGKTDSCVSINETRTHPHSIHINKLKVA